ncbi:S53 family peptidase [Aspergillus clavatus NRRL 1]|uniref:tripeptidyl-peptidase II n=1 Tax=Aspergillus clavatus (strain ATCC 1007 / CBS 513.65 / DSM 816 / NCTC 3887 / NRRL 1 / QM 1276 / 107) TaxID=344612 RepID=A1CK11_ASPCL|nr:tripeptidyl peptidase SED3 [Aspergillus clavatus NRRL 1]EAW09485.1 tripeptidyl peptidase SED3 [Aspergillus clavatus NRRL 1]
MFSVTSLALILSIWIAFFRLQATALSSYAVVEHLHDVPENWVKRNAAPGSELVRFRLAMEQIKTAEFEKRVIDMSTPGHRSYGHHMNRDELKEFLRPSEQTLDNVLAWLKAESVSANSIENHGNWVTFTVPVSHAEQMLKTRFYTFQHKETGAMVIRTLEYSVPKQIHSSIQTIQPTIRFGRPIRHGEPSLFEGTLATQKDLSADCSEVITPSCLRQLYGIPVADVKPDTRNKLGVSGFLDQYARYSDFEEFMRRFAPNRTGFNFSVVSINGGVNLQDSYLGSTEASLDTQYAYSLAYSTPGTFYTTRGHGPEVSEGGRLKTRDTNTEPYLDQLHYLLSLPDEELPAVLSTSYGEDEQTVPESFANATCNLFAQLGARGVSVIFSSGDSGVGSPCVTNDGTKRARFLPVFPATCPFVTAVGGTHQINPEKAIAFSGGGFSDRFARPSYQDTAVQSYLDKLGERWNGLYNPRGRAIPDVAAQAFNFLIIDHGKMMKIGGTSARICGYNLKTQRGAS